MADQESSLLKSKPRGMVAKIVIPPNVPVNDLYATANMTASNALTTTNVFATNVVATGQMTILGTRTLGKASLLVTGNVVVSNAFTTGNVFTNTFVLNESIQVTQGNVFVSNALTTTNVYVTGQVISTASLVNRYADGFSIVVPTGNAYVSNAVTTSNIVTSNVTTAGNVVVHNTVSTGFTTLDVVGNTYVSNAVSVSNVVTTNVYAVGNVVVSGTSTVDRTTIGITGNAAVSNTVSTANVFALGNVMARGNITVTGNAYVANAVTTTNVLTTNVLASGQVIITGVQTTGYTALNVVGNVAVSNAFVIPSTGLGVNTGNVVAGGTLTVTTITTSGILALNVAGNVVASNALTTNDDVFTGNTVATGLLTVTNLGKTDKFTALTVSGNVAVSNALVTTNVFAGNVYATGNLFVQGGNSVLGRTTLIVDRSPMELGNMYVSNALVTSNISANMWSANLATSVNVTGNMYSRNNITTQNLFTTNVFAATSVRVNNTGLSVDPSTGGILVSTVASSTQAQTYPPAAMTGYTLTIPGGGGTYTASASTENVTGSQNAWKAFDGRNGYDGVDNIWKSNGGGYNAAGTGLYTGALSTGGYNGEWVQLQVPAGIILTGYTITAYLGTTGVYAHNPRKWFVFGSNDASTWTLLDSRSGVTSWTLNQGQTYSASGSTAFTYFRIVVNEIQSAAGILNVVIGELSLSGTMATPLPINARNLPVYVESGVTSTVFPPSAMSADTTVIGTGTYVASASSTYDNVTFQAYRAFDKNATTVWQQQLTPAYSTTDGSYIGTTTTSFSTTVGGVPYYGEWLQIQLPTANVLSSYAITSRGSPLGGQAPATFYIMGSNDGTTFTLVDTQTSVSWLASGGETKTFTASSPYPFTRYRLVSNKITGSGTAGYTSIAAWDLNCLSPLGYNIGDEYYDTKYLYKMMGPNPNWRSIARPIPLAPDISAQPVLITSGGTETTPYSRFKLHTFTSSGTFTVSGTGIVEVLVVAGGGSGGSRHQGGGGGGGVVYVERYPISSGQYTVTVGTGGAANAGAAGPGTSGTNSVFGSLTALGGGGGSIAMSTPGIFGCGGGHSPQNVAMTITGTDGQGFPGGFGTYTAAGQTSYGGGGGGGAGSAGRNADGAASVTAGSGGVGFMSNITGTNTFYGGGGGGGCATDSTLYGYGGLGGGGRGGGGGGTTTGVAGTDGLGGGGGCGGFNGGTNYASGKGGNGVVIIKVPTTTDVVIQTLTVSDQIVIPVRQNRPVNDVERVTWGLTGQPSPVYIDNETNTGCNIVIPTGTYTSATSTLTVTAKNSAGSAGSITLPLTFRFSPPSYPGLVCWQDRSSWDATARTWADMSGRGNNGFNGSGTVTVQSNFITGTTATQMTWPTLMPQTYTFFHVAKYNSGTLGTNTARIFSSTNINWLSGFWANRSGVAYHYGWLSATNVHGLNWVMSTDQPYLYRSNGTRRNDTDQSGVEAPLVSNSPRGVTINTGSSPTEISDWAVAEIIVYDRTLSSTEILTVEAYLRAKYPGFSL